VNILLHTAKALLLHVLTWEKMILIVMQTHWLNTSNILLKNVQALMLQMLSWKNIMLKIDNEIYLYEMLTTNLLQAMLVKRAEKSHQHWQSSNSALLTRWAYTQSKSKAMTTRSSARWSSYIHRMTATFLHTCCSSYTTYTHILRRHNSAFAHIQTDVMQ